MSHPPLRHHLVAPLASHAAAEEEGLAGMRYHLPPDNKLHAAHSHSLRSTVLDPLILRFRQFRTQNVPAPVLAVLVLLAFLSGTWVHTVDDLPAPGGPELMQVGGGRRQVLMTEAQHTIQPQAQAPSVAPLADPLHVEDFERLALSDSGFARLRPALDPVPESGEPYMRVIPFQTISWFPRITYYPGFVDKQRAEHIMNLAKKYMSPSALAYRPGESIPETQNVRTSTGTFLVAAQDQDGVLAWLEDRIASVTHLPVEHGEAFNCLRYMPTQHYDSHLDWFPEDLYGKQNSNRIATFLLFLSDVEEGGETVFKREGRENGNRTIEDWRTCDDNIGLKVKPKQGDAVLFWSATPDNQLDTHALHGACPVIKGEKWSIAKWIREKPIGPPRHY